MMEVSIEEMVEFIYDRCADDLTEEQIEMVLELQQEFLDSKGLIELEGDDIYNFRIDDRFNIFNHYGTHNYYRNLQLCSC